MMKQILFLPLRSFPGVESLHTHIHTYSGSELCKLRKTLGLFLIEFWVRIPDTLLTKSVTLDKILYLFETLVVFKMEMITCISQDGWDK